MIVFGMGRIGLLCTRVQTVAGDPGHLRRQTDDHDGDLASDVVVGIGSSVNECLAPLSLNSPLKLECFARGQD